jgi:hypothetical protein
VVVGALQCGGIASPTLVIGQGRSGSVDLRHCATKSLHYVQSMDAQDAFVEREPEQSEDILRLLDTSQLVLKSHGGTCRYACIGSKVKTPFLHVRPQASHPMQASGFSMLAQTFVDSYSSMTSFGCRTSCAQIFMQRPQPMHFSSSMFVTYCGVHSFLPRVSPVT